MDATTQHMPQLFKGGRHLGVGTLIADPSLTIIEVQDGTGLLLAESCYHDALGEFHLETVTWIRLSYGFILELVDARSFDDVVLHRHDTGLFVARDTRSQKVFPHPSRQSYCVVFLSEDEYRMLKSNIEEEAEPGLPGLVQQKIQELPGFSCDELSVTAPEDYASAEIGSLENELLDD
jgi:hypothetical protein